MVWLRVGCDLQWCSLDGLQMHSRGTMYADAPGTGTRHRFRFQLRSEYISDRARSFTIATPVAMPRTKVVSSKDRMTYFLVGAEDR